MKTFNLALFAAVLLTARSFGGDHSDDWGVATNGLQMSIRLKSSAAVVKTNEPIVLTIRFRNISANRMFVALVRDPKEDLPGLRLAVTPPAGKTLLVPSKSGDGSAHVLRLPPGQTSERNVDLSRFYRPSEPGKYQVTATFEFDELGTTNRLDVTSNQLQITLPPAG